MLPARCCRCAACRTSWFWHPHATLGKGMMRIWFYELTAEDWIYGICTPHKHGIDQNVTQNLCLSLPSITTKEYLFPAFLALEPSGAQKTGAQVYCLKIKTWPSISVGVRQNRRKARKIVGEQIVKTCLILFTRKIISTI